MLGQASERDTSGLALLCLTFLPKRLKLCAYKLQMAQTQGDSLI
jgi:hypothetical protein